MSVLRLGYVSNGLADHRLGDALALLGDSGYQGVALTLDHHHLDPFAPDLAVKVRQLARQLERHRLAVVIETGARFLLSPRDKHQPTLLSDPGDGRRLALLRRAVKIGADLGAEAVSFWSGCPGPNTPRAVAWERLVASCEILLDVAEQSDVPLAFEPEPGMLVDRLAGYQELLAALGAPPRFGLTLDVGHCQCNEDEPVAALVTRYAERIRQVHIEDMRRGVHDHLWFGAGEIDFPPVLAALVDAGYRGLVSVELPRHSHEAHLLVPAAAAFLGAAEGRSAA